jgi:thioredoxin 1
MMLDTARFATEVLGSQEPVLVDFYGSWCPPCERLAPLIDKLAGQGYRVCKVNVQAQPELAARYHVSAVPTLLVLRGGEETARFVGVQSERTLRAALDGARQPA